MNEKQAAIIKELKINVLELDSAMGSYYFPLTNNYLIHKEIRIDINGLLHFHSYEAGLKNSYVQITKEKAIKLIKLKNFE